MDATESTTIVNSFESRHAMKHDAGLITCGDRRFMLETSFQMSAIVTKSSYGHASVAEAMEY